jgi:hypothetical protein
MRNLPVSVTENILQLVVGSWPGHAITSDRLRCLFRSVHAFNMLAASRTPEFEGVSSIGRETGVETRRVIFAPMPFSNPRKRLTASIWIKHGSKKPQQIGVTF